MPVTIIKSDPRGREKPCLRCGYSLRKITDASHCPECGLSVWLSLNQNDTLDMSNPEWLRRMALGLWILAMASVLAGFSFPPPAPPKFSTNEGCPGPPPPLSGVPGEGGGDRPPESGGPLPTNPPPPPGL